MTKQANHIAPTVDAAQSNEREPAPAMSGFDPSRYPDFIYGIHESGGESLMRDAGRLGWVLELAAIGLDGASTPADFSSLANSGFGVIVRINHGYGTVGTIPLPHQYHEFAQACARYVGRSRGCHIWIIGNEPNHADERPMGRYILPREYANCYQLCRAAIRNVPGHEHDQVLLASPGPWNATTSYLGNEKGDWIEYFIDTMAALDDDECDGISLHTYTHDLDTNQIRGDFFHHTSGYRHLRNEFRTYRDYMNAIPDRFRHLPVYITETDPTTRGKGWNPGNNVAWVQAAYQEIAQWNQDPNHQPILALILYRWPAVPDQPEWSISNRPGIQEDIRQALRLQPENLFRVRLPGEIDQFVVHEPGSMLPVEERWRGMIMSPLGLNMRTGPTLQHRIIQILPDETAITVLAELEEWLFVSTMGKRGYVSRNFVLRQEGTEPIGPIQPGDLLRARPELLSAPLAPSDAERIVIDHETATWTESVVAHTWNSYGGLIAQLADLLHLDPAIATAVFAVESGGHAFAGDGRMLIRFEVHIFFEEWGKIEPERFSQHLRFNLEKPWQDHQWRSEPIGNWQDFHGNQQAEWNVFMLARAQLNANAALRAISMGAPQIMGFNHSVIGFDSAMDMFEEFSTSANSQIIGFYDFVNATPDRVRALREGNYHQFASAYNGSGQAQLYAELIDDAVAVVHRLRAESGSDSAHNDETENHETSQDSNIGRLPLPPQVENLAESDRQLYEAWRNHLIRGFENNELMFQRVLHAFMHPYYMTLWMYRLLFVIGLAAFVAGIALSIWTGQPIFSAIFGGFGLASFLSFFIGKPLHALERNLQTITWLGVIYNSYWVRILYALNLDTIQQDLREITNDFVAQVERLLASSSAGDRRNGWPRNRT